MESPQRPVALPLPPHDYQSLVCGPGNEHWFEWVGEWVVDLLKRHEMVGSGAVVLDVGCGCGRVARHLMAEPIRVYIGFDRHQGMIQWCADELTSRDPRFHFEHAPVKSVYSVWDAAVGGLEAADFVFPYPSQHFDTVLLASVFTHMPLHEIRHYLGEIKRVTKSGGRVLLSIFFSDTGTKLMDDVNFFHDWREFLGVVADSGFIAQAESPSPEYGYQQNWYVLRQAEKGISDSPAV